MKTMALGGAALLIFSTVQAAFPSVFYFLPLGDSPIAEMGIVLGMSVAIGTIVDLIGKGPHG